MPKQPISSQTGSRRLKPDDRAWIRIRSKPGISSEALNPNRENAWLGTVRDVSPAGIGLIVGQHVEPGTELILELFSETNETVQLPVRVIHATPEANGQWVIGCQLARALRPHEMSIFLDD
jgi:hypothetical protein